MFVRIMSVIIATLFSFSSFAGELEDRRVISNQVGQIITDMNLGKEKGFSKLEAIGEAFRRNETRTSSGLWKLNLFYGGILGTYDFDVYEDNYVQMFEIFWDAYQAEIPTSPTPIIGKAKFYIALAWYYRGESYASDVSAPNMRRFIINMGKAEDVLFEGQTIGKTDPEWYATMLTVLGVQRARSADFNDVLWEGMQKYPDYYGIYFVAATHLERRWSGDDGLLDLFARYAMAHTAVNKGAAVYTRIYWHIQGYYGNQLFYRTDVDWDLMKLGILDILKEYPDEWNIQHFASFACNNFDGQMTEWLIDQMNEEPIEGAWKLRTFEACRDYVIPPALGTRSWPDDYRSYFAGHL